MSVFDRLPRRQRYIARAAAGAAVFLLLALAAFWRASGGGPAPYRPGEAVDGLTAGLERGLPTDAPRITFTDVSEAAGIRFRHFPDRRTTRLPEDMGSGAAWGDYDGDGWADLFVVNQAGRLDLSPDEVAVSPGRSMLFRNRRDGTFEERAEAAGVAFRGTGMAAAWADYDDDGHVDLLVTSYGGLVLYRNRGDGTFRDATWEAGLGGLRGYWAGASWADYDRDGDLDVYVAGYVRYRDLDPGESGADLPQYDIEQPATLNPSAFAPERNLLLRNGGDGTFADVAGVAGVADRTGRSLSAAWADFDGDGWLDLYVANDLSDNRLFRNLGTGAFEDVSHPALVADYRGSMGIAVGDWDGDADPDLFLTHWIAQENALYTNQRGPGAPSAEDAAPGPLRFMDEADRHGLGQVALDYVGWGTSFFDYDNDGRLDLLVVNGSTLQRDDDPGRLVAMPAQLFWNGGPARGFFDVSSLAGPYFEEARVGRGAAFADYDRDGDVDVFIVNHGDRGALLRNDAGADNGWIQVELVARGSGRSALGATVAVRTAGETQVRQVGSQPSYLSQNSPVEHFGLGLAATVDTLEVRWPAGAVQVVTDLPARSRVRLVEGGAPEVTPLAGLPGPDAAAGPPGVAALNRESVRSFWRHFREATSHRVSGRLQEAALAYSRALTLDPGHEDTLYYLGSVLLDLGRFAEAAEVLGRLVRVNPRSGRGYGRLGTLHLCRPSGPADERMRAAEAAFRRAAELNPEATGNHLRLAEVALLRNDRAAAVRALETVLGSDPASGTARFLLGYLAWADGREDRALELFRSALEGPGAAAPLASGEGDTKPGGLPAPVDDGCATLVALERQLRADGATPPGDASSALMERRYRELEDRLERRRR